MIEQGIEHDMGTGIAHIANQIVALGSVNSGHGVMPRRMMRDSTQLRIDSYFDMVDCGTRADHFTATLASNVRKFYEDYAQENEHPVLNRIVAAWAALGAEEHDLTMQTAFKESVAEAAQTPANKKAITVWFVHEHAKGNNLCPDRRTALQSTAKALGLDLA